MTWLSWYLIIGVAFAIVRASMQRAIGLPQDSMAEMCLQVLLWLPLVAWYFVESLYEAVVEILEEIRNERK